MGAGIEVKVEPYDGTYECLFCGESVRGQPALKCCQCNSNPFHRACDPQSKYAEVCPTCGRKTVEAWKGASAGTAAPSEMIDLTDLEGDWGGAGEEAALTGNGAQEEHRGRRQRGGGRCWGAGCMGGASRGGQWEQRQGQGACHGRWRARGWRRRGGDGCGGWWRWRRRQGQGTRGQWPWKGSQRIQQRWGEQWRKARRRAVRAHGWLRRQEGNGERGGQE